MYTIVNTCIDDLGNVVGSLLKLRVTPGAVTLVSVNVAT
jgi:hypothetical protein